MSILTMEKASVNDSEKLTNIMKDTFDKEAERWLPKDKKVLDYNIQPPGYSSNEMTKYMMKVLHYYKVIVNEEIVGGVIITISGKSYGRIDRIYVSPRHQGKGYGTKIINLIENEFPNVTTWDLETSSRQKNNHHFYEKVGYKTIHKTEEEYCYIKKIATNRNQEKLVQNKEITDIQYENCNMVKSEFYQVNLQESSISNSNVMNSHFSNCNLSNSIFQNINYRRTLFADLNLSHSELLHVSLSGVHFGDTDLGDEKEPLSFERCDLEGTKINNSNLKNAEITSSNITGMKINNIEVKDLLDAYYQLNNK